MQTTTYQRKPLIVEAVQVTDENIYDVAKWCGGDVRTNTTTNKKFIQLEVIHPQNPSQTKALAGNWILKSDQGYKIWSDSAFKKGFELPALKMGTDMAGAMRDALKIETTN